MSHGCKPRRMRCHRLKKNDTWELVDLPNGKSTIGVKWIYKLKFNMNGNISKHKARLVAQGYVQPKGCNVPHLLER